MNGAPLRRITSLSVVVAHTRAIWRRLRRMPLRELVTTIRAAVVLVAVEATIRWVPLPRLSRLLGVRLDLDAVSQPGVQLTADELPERANRALGATRRVTRYWPFCSGPCLRRALVGGHLVRDLQPALRIGVGGPGDGIGAHAWLEIDRRPLEDVADLRAFTRISSAAGLPSA